MASSPVYNSHVSRRQPAWWKWLLAVAAGALVAGGLVWFGLDRQAAAAEAPRISTCQANLRALGQAVKMYAADYGETLPSSGSESAGDVRGLLEPYLRSPDAKSLWRCPSQTPYASGRWTGSYGYNWQYLLVAGSDYPHTDWHGFGRGGLKLASLARPAQTLMFVDQRPVYEKSYAELWTFVVRPRQSLKDPSELNGMGRVDLRHRGQANVLFCDGHVRLVGAKIADPANETKYWDPR